MDTLPAGLTATAISGAGWTTNLGTLTCTRSDALAAGAAYPPITVTVNVAANAPASVTNTATVSGGGDTNPANNTASDPTTINAAAAPTVTTGTATAVGTTTATLNGTVNPNGQPATVQFQYGTDYQLRLDRLRLRDLHRRRHAGREREHHRPRLRERPIISASPRPMSWARPPGWTRRLPRQPPASRTWPSR